jgi:hypothetical protein
VDGFYSVIGGHKILIVMHQTPRPTGFSDRQAAIFSAKSKTQDSADSVEPSYTPRLRALPTVASAA